MPACPYCQNSVRWWDPLIRSRGKVFYCPHCERALRIDWRRQTFLTMATIPAIASANLISTEHHYALLMVFAVIGLVAVVLFAKVLPAEPAAEPG